MATAPKDVPPRDDRAAKRACALAAVTGRALLEQEDRNDPGVEQTRQRILQWVDQLGIGDELEPDEWKLLQLPLGAPPQRDSVNATWRLEGLGVLAWAHQRFELPPHDQLVNVPELLTRIGVPDPDRSAEFLRGASLRPRNEIEKMRERLFAIHWRLTEWRLRHSAMDFVSVAKTAWFGPLELDGVETIENDLGIGGHSISRAPAEAIGAATSAAMERHLAINWLCTGGDRYSDTDVST